MKQFTGALIGMLVMLMPLWAKAQESPAQKWLQSFDGKKGFTTVSISSTMFKMLSKIKPSDPDYKEITHFAAKLEDFKIVVVEDDNHKSAAGAEFNRLVANAPLGNYDELMSVNESGNHIAFRVQQQDDHIRELIMTITGTDQVILFIKGDFKLSELTSISDDMNITGINKIKKLKK